MEEELEDYIERHIDAEPPLQSEIERFSNLHLLNGRMCSGHIQGRLLRMLTIMIAPRRVLELGTFSGYSALSIAEGLAEGAMLHTVEVEDELEEYLRGIIDKSGFSDRITLHIGDAEEVCAGFGDESFDMIFIDADKRRYPGYYERSLELLRHGGFILADNTLWYGHVLESSGQADAQTRGIKDFNDIVAADPRVEKVILPIRDGLTIIRKI